MQNYFAPEDSGVRIKIFEDEVFIKPSIHENHNDSFELSDRGTRGKQILISDVRIGEELLKTFGQWDTERYPYFVLKVAKHGWLHLCHYEDEEAPRMVSHIRFWVPKDGVYKVPATASQPVDLDEMIQLFVGKVKNAHERIHGERRPGRPSRLDIAQTAEAQEIWSTFSALAASPQHYIQN